MRRPMARFSQAGAGAAMAALLAVAFAPAAAGDTIKLRYGQAYSAARSIFSLPVAVADREGFFAREGLELEFLVPIPGGADNQITALTIDSVVVTHVDTLFLIGECVG